VIESKSNILNNEIKSYAKAKEEKNSLQMSVEQLAINNRCSRHLPLIPTTA